MTLIPYIAGLILFSFLMVLTYVDIKSYRLPNILTFPLILLGLGLAHILGLPLRDHIIGAVIGYLAFVAIEKAFLKLRGYPGLGRGDAKLLAAGGAWTGWYGLPYIVLLASLAGLSIMFAAILTGRLTLQYMKKKAMPFGPFLSFAILLVWFALILQPLLKA